MRKSTFQKSWFYKVRGLNFGNIGFQGGCRSCHFYNNQPQMTPCRNRSRKIDANKLKIVVGSRDKELKYEKSIFFFENLGFEILDGNFRKNN